MLFSIIFFAGLTATQQMCAHGVGAMHSGRQQRRFAKAPDANSCETGFCVHRHAQTPWRERLVSTAGRDIISAAKVELAAPQFGHASVLVQASPAARPAADRHATLAGA